MQQENKHVETTPVCRGRIKWFSPEKGYGFIELESRRDVFVHFSAIQEEARQALSVGSEIEFTDKYRPKDE
jgi:CspA family cold shock protein